MPIKSKSGRSKDVRRLYHASGKLDPMKVWARIVAGNRTGTDEQVALVMAWLKGK